MATRNHVAMAAWSREKSDVSGRSRFDWSGQLVRLKCSTVLLVMVYLTNGLAESGENLENMWERANLISDRELPFICMGDWNMIPEEMQKTELVSSIGAVIKTPVGVEYTCTSGNRLLDYALVDRRLASVVQVEPYWAVPWKSHSGGHSLQSAAYSYNENCVHTKKNPLRERAWERTIGTKIGPRDKGRCLRPSRKRALYHRWPAAAKECILKSCEPGCKEACRGRGTVLKTRTVSIIPRVAKDESHAGAGEARIWAGLVSKIQSIDKLRYTGIGCEHGQTMIKVLKTVFASRLQKLASQVETDRVHQVKSWIWNAQHVEE